MHRTRLECQNVRDDKKLELYTQWWGRKAKAGFPGSYSKI